MEIDKKKASILFHVWFKRESLEWASDSHTFLKILISLKGRGDRE